MPDKDRAGLMGRGKKRSLQRLVELQAGRYVPFFSSQRQQLEHENKKPKTSLSQCVVQEELIARLVDGREETDLVEQDPPLFLSTLNSTIQQPIIDSELCPTGASRPDNHCTMQHSGFPISTMAQLLDKGESTKLTTHSQLQEKCSANFSSELQLPIQISLHISSPSSSHCSTPSPNSPHCSPPSPHLSNLCPPSTHHSPFSNLSNSPCIASPALAVTTEMGHHTPTTILATLPADTTHSVDLDTREVEQTSLCEAEAIEDSGREGRGRGDSREEEEEGSMASLPYGLAAQPNSKASGGSTEACLEQSCLMKDPPQPPYVLVTRSASLQVTALSEGNLLLQGIIQELSKLNETILRSKRELDSMRQHYSRSTLL